AALENGGVVQQTCDEIARSDGACDAETFVVQGPRPLRIRAIGNGAGQVVERACDAHAIAGSFIDTASLLQQAHGPVLLTNTQCRTALAQTRGGDEQPRALRLSRSTGGSRGRLRALEIRERLGSLSFGQVEAGILHGRKPCSEPLD